MGRGQILSFFIGSVNPIMTSSNAPTTETSMKTLLQIQTSMFSAGGQSSLLAEKFVAEWRPSNPKSRVIVPHLGAQPLPHRTPHPFQSFPPNPQSPHAP